MTYCWLNHTKRPIIYLAISVAIIFLLPHNLAAATSFSKSLSETVVISNEITSSSSKFSFDFGNHADADGQTTPLGITPIPVHVTYDDHANPVWHDGKVDSIQVTVKSSQTGASIQLALVEISSSCTDVNCPGTPDTGFFRNDNLVFLDGNNLFSMSDAVKLSITDTLNVGHPLPITIISNSSLAINDPGLSLNLAETTPGSGIYSGTFSFTSGLSSGTKVHAVPGDVITITDQNAVVSSNALIIPNPRQDVGALHVSSTDTVTASYGGLITTTIIGPQGGESGGGGGGPVVTTPGLVLDALLGIGGGSSGAPPSFGLSPSFLQEPSLPASVKDSILHPDPLKPISPISNSALDLPLTIDGNSYALPLRANTIVTNTEQTGNPVKLKMVLHDPYNVIHLSMFTNLREKARDIGDSDTAIIYDQNKPLLIQDPHGYFSDVKVTESNKNDRYEFDYEITFAKPMDKSDIIFRAWNDRYASTDVDLFDAWKIIQSTQMSPTQTSPSQASAPQTPLTQTSSNSNSVSEASSGVAILPTNSIDLMGAIKDWGGYSPNPISDSELLGKIGIKGQHLPNWVMKTTKWVVDGETTPDDFVGAINYLYSKNMIK